MGVNGGVLISEVKKGGPADQAGILPEDIIVAVGERPVKDGDELQARVADMPIGATTLVTVDRDGKRKDFKLTVQERTQVFADDERVVGARRPSEDPGKPEVVEPGKFGFGVRPVSEQEKQAAVVKSGVAVSRVEPNSFADDIGLAERDIITAINRKPVNSSEDVVAIRKSLKPGDPVVFRVVRRRGGNIPTAGSGTRFETQFLSGSLPEN
jgi:serine protease Do